MDKPHAMVRLLARVIGVGIETADMLVHEVLSRNLRDRRAVARYAGLTGSPRRERQKRGARKGWPKAGNARVRRGMIQLAWRFLSVPEGQRLGAVVSCATTDGPRRHAQDHDRGLARKLLIALWRLVTTGEVPDGVVLRPAQ